MSERSKARATEHAVLQVLESARLDWQLMEFLVNLGSTHSIVRKFVDDLEAEYRRQCEDQKPSAKIETTCPSLPSQVKGYNFTERVRKVFSMARQEALRLGHEYVGTEHLLLGLLKEGEGVAAAALQNLSVDLDEVEHQIERTVLTGKPGQAIGPDIPYTSRAQKALQLAMQEAREILHHSYVGTEHILLGLIREEKGIAGQTLIQNGVTLEAVRTEILRLLG